MTGTRKILTVSIDTWPYFMGDEATALANWRVATSRTPGTLSLSARDSNLPVEYVPPGTTYVSPYLAYSEADVRHLHRNHHYHANRYAQDGYKQWDMVKKLPGQVLSTAYALILGNNDATIVEPKRSSCSCLFVAEALACLSYIGLFLILTVDVMHSVDFREDASPIDFQLVVIYTACQFGFCAFWAFAIRLDYEYHTNETQEIHPRHFLSNHKYFVSFAIWSFFIMLFAFCGYNKNADLHIKGQFAHRYSLRCQRSEFWHPDYCPYFAVLSWWSPLHFIVIGYGPIIIPMFHEVYAHQRFVRAAKLIPDAIV